MQYAETIDGLGCELLFGRAYETGVLSELLAGIRSGHGASLVVRGEAGIGKTALIDEVINGVVGIRVVRVTGVESEMELAFGGLHQMCRPVLDRLAGLPAPQSDALSTAFGLSVGPPPDRFLVGLAVLGLLSELAAELPVVCVVDDAQWLDQESAQAVAFAARRLKADAVLIVFATRDPMVALSGIPELAIERLRRSDARALLDSALPWPLDHRVRDRVVAETRGNPLALLELPKGLSPTALAGGFGLTGTTPLAGQIQESFRRRVEALGDESRLLTIVAAADPAGDPALVWQAAAGLGLGSNAAVEVLESGLVEIGSEVLFRHPLARSAAYQSASPEERIRVHVAIAQALDPVLDADRRAWHRARATVGSDGEVASELERSAWRAQERGGVAAAAAFLERAAELTAEPRLRAQRELAAAEAKHRAGVPDTSLGLIAIAESGPLDARERAHADLLRAKIAYTLSRGNDAPRLLVRAARRLEPLDPSLARATYLDALWAAHFSGRLSVPGWGVLDVARAAREAPGPEGRPSASDLLLDGLAAANVEGYGVGVPVLKQAIDRFKIGDITPNEEQNWLWVAAQAALIAFDDESYETLSARHVDLGRRTGLLAVLPMALSSRTAAHVLAGEMGTAVRLIDEQRVIAEAIGSTVLPYGRLVTAAWRGRESDVFALKETSLQDAAARGEGAALAVADYADAVLYNGMGRYKEALAAALATDNVDDGYLVRTVGLVEVIDAAAHCGDTGLAREALARLSDMAATAGTDWVAGVRARSEALVSEGAAAEGLYREALERLGRTRVRVEVGRTHLLFGEWLRREGRRADARDQLRTAFGMLSEMGVEAFADRAELELRATGETARARPQEPQFDLTTQEIQIADLAAGGRTNPEIGAQLFISARTVEWHLRKVFVKLGITSRRQLQGMLPEIKRSSLNG